MSEKNLLKGKVAVVTGSGQGVGRALAIGLAEHGAKVITNNRKPGSTGNAMLTGKEYGRLSAEKKEWYDRVQAELNGDAETTASEIRRRGGMFCRHIKNGRCRKTDTYSSEYLWTH